ncbi:MAG: lamin tail domain-containing protein, partial [Candidatus Nealsonbacteria bacterium]|nr:lamin tail domain-containing protein [Candidatus Nealsonbacteria bacterium]
MRGFREIVERTLRPARKRSRCRIAATAVRGSRLSIEPLEPRVMLDGSPVITEFMAINNATLDDTDGDYSDWIEIHNPTGSPFDLDGWYLTDDARHRAKWRFPDYTMATDEHLIVFASGKNRTNPADELHTSFQLSGSGDYLALVDSDGATIVSEYGPGGEDYPPQFDDVSYGITDGSAAISLVGEASTANVLVPSGGALGTAWTEAGFTPDGSWTAGPLGVGYDPGGAMLRLDFNDRDDGESDAADTESGFDTFTLSQNGATFNGIKVTLTDLGGATRDDRDRSTPVDAPPAFTLDQIYDDFIFADGIFDGAGMEVLVEGLVPDVEYVVKLWSFDSGSGGGRVSDWTEVGGTMPVTIEDNYTFDGNDLPTGNDDYTMTAALTSSATGKLQIRGVRNGGTSHGVFLNAIEIRRPGISDLIRTDVGPQMRGENASAFVRSEFLVPADALYEQLTLRMNYDAGFVAYLNGAEVARRNAPGSTGTPPAFNASATQERTLEETLESELFDLTGHLNHLNAGAANVLAIHGLNSSAGEDDFLILPELTAVDLEGGGMRYFVPATPAATNEAGLLGFVEDTTFSVDRGFYDAPFTVEVTTATPGATIIYTTDGSEPSPVNGVQVPATTAAVAPVAAVPVGTTTYLRATAIKQAYMASNVDTQTYIFLNDVIAQDPTPGVDYPATWQSSEYSGDYQMDPQVVGQWDDDNPLNTDYGIRESLRSLPTMSIVMNHEDLWGSSTGIYNHATSRGSSWRERASIEYFDPATGKEFQVNAGVQMHGGASRDNERLKKHSFRLVFSEEFGPTTFDFPLFSGSDIDEINTIVLKCFFTDGFATRTVANRYNPIDSQYLRDTWMSDSMLAMGNPDTHAEYVHLYINGLYWGLYSPLERPDDAFMAEYLGGLAENYDVIKDFNELFRGSKTAWNAMFALANAGLATDAAYQRIQGNNPDGTPNAAYPNYLNVDNLIDFMILHLYSGAEDWPHHNWYAARDRVGETQGFKFFTWDQEIVIDDLYRDKTEVSNDMTPARLYSRLRANAEFRLRFADRVHKHLFNGGALAVEPAQARWMDRADQIEMAIIAESARWGDAREGQVIQIRSGQPTVTVPTLTVDHWRTERDIVHDVYIPGAHWRTVDRFQDDNLYTTTVPPTFNQHGGEIDAEFDVVLTAPAGTIYFTTDGTDPRLTGGSVNNDATIYNGTFRLPDSAMVKARVRSGGQWSALTEATFLVGRPPLVITEINYHPYNATPAELATQDPLELPFDQDDFEFIELTNTGTTAVDLTGVHFSRDVDYQFPDDATLAPDAYAVLVRNPAAFSVRYPGVAVAGTYLGALGNGGDEVQLCGRFDQLIVGFTYNDVDEWPGRCDGKGATLEVIDPQLVPGAPGQRTAHLDDGENWHSSVAYGGTPGGDPAPEHGIVINEVLSHTDWPQFDTIELHNTSGDPVDVGGWYLSDSWGWDPLVAEGANDSYKKYRIATDTPAETTIAAGGYLVFDERDFNPTPGDPAPNHFALNGDEGDDVWLMGTDASGNLTQFGDHVEFGAQANGESWG